MDEDEDTSNTTVRSNTRLSDADYATCKELYELGKKGLVELADEYGVSRQTLSRRFRKDNVVKASRAHEVAKAAAQVVERFAEKRSEWIEETRMQGMSALKQAALLSQKLVVDQAKKMASGGHMAEIDDDLKAMGRYNKILIDNLEARLRILRADEHVDSEDLPTLSIEDLTEREILDHHIGTGALPEDATIEDLNTGEFEDDEDDLVEEEDDD